MIPTSLGFLLLALSLSAAAPREIVFLLHGMGRTRASMVILGLRLRRAGYHPVLLPYDTVNDSLDESTAAMLRRIAEQSRGGRYHVLGHSLGNVLIRNGFKSGYPPGLGRVVMLAPPNGPARLAAAFKDNAVYRWRTGDAGQKLADPAFYEGLSVPGVEFGVIAGTRGLPFYFGEPNDGILGVSATRQSKMTDYLEVGHSHTFLMNSPEVFSAAECFLKTGAFCR